ncbi:hypothetical protein GF389_00685 [Candidatus Dojkabacteria bacterium]|nr:hypothetical protein [Candidatus Dojkabacteria bacterium]
MTEITLVDQAKYYIMCTIIFVTLTMVGFEDGLGLQDVVEVYGEYVNVEKPTIKAVLATLVGKFLQDSFRGAKAGLRYANAGIGKWVYNNVLPDHDPE